jgi:hypothetical protein
MLLSASLATTFSLAREFEDGTIRELVMTPKPIHILGGKIFSAAVQGMLVTVFILLEEWVIFGYLPENMLMQIVYFFWGVLFSIGLAAIIAVKVKQILPAGILVMVINFGSWWVSGGLAPSKRGRVCCVSLRITVRERIFIRSLSMHRFWAVSVMDCLREMHS